VNRVKPFFRDVWLDIRAGRNINVYIVVLLALLVAMLSLFGLAAVHWALAIILSALVLIAVQGLQTNALVAKLQTTRGMAFRSYDDSEYASEISQCKRVSMIVTANDRFLAANGRAFRDCLDGGGQIRELLFDASSEWGMRAVTSRSTGSSKNAEYIVLRSQVANTKIKELAEYGAPGTVVVRKTPHPAAHVILWIEFSNAPGAIYLTPGAFGIRTEDRLTVRISEYDNKTAYTYFATYFNNLWEWEETREVKTLSP
jgi:hypothetical protein